MQARLQETGELESHYLALKKYSLLQKPQYTFWILVKLICFYLLAL